MLLTNCTRVVLLLLPRLLSLFVAPLQQQQFTTITITSFRSLKMVVVTLNLDGAELCVSFAVT